MALFVEENSYFRNGISKKMTIGIIKKKIKIHHLFKKSDFLYPYNYIQDQLCVE